VQGRGLGSGCKSTAAGRYQIIKPTWLSLKSKLGLPDFSPASQDAAAIELIRQRGALADVQAGRIESAVNKCAKVWAYCQALATVSAK
jgi:lysozyme